MTAVDTTDLSAAEADLLATAEAVIERGLQTFIEVADALTTVRDNRLYRTTFPTFEAYCQQRWGFSDSRARQLIGAAQTVTNVTALGLPAPANEGQARALAQVPEDQRAEVWAETLDRTGGKPTAAAVAETIKHRPLWKCAGCGEVSPRAKAPKACPSCQTPAFDDVVQALAVEVTDPARQWVFIRYRAQGEQHHQVFPTGDVTFCQRSTIGGHILPAGVLIEKYGSTPCAACWPPAAPAADARRWECWGCAHTWTSPPDPGRDVAACPKCGVQHPVNLGPAEPVDGDDEPTVDTGWHCRSCGRTQVNRPDACPECGSKTNFMSHGGDEVPDIDADGRCLTCAPHGHDRERVYVVNPRQGVEYHRFRNAGRQTGCGARTKYGDVMTRGDVRQQHAGRPCGVCWPDEAEPAPAGDPPAPTCPKSCRGCDSCIPTALALAAARDAKPAADPDPAFDGVHRGFRSWGSSPNGAGMRCTCGTVLDGFATVADASMVMDRHVAEAIAATDDPADDPTPPAEVKHCEKCHAVLGDEAVLLGYLRCDGCDDQGDHVSIDGGPCLVCAPDDHAAEKVWMAADRSGLAYHRLTAETRTACDRTFYTGRVMTRGEATREIGGTPCRRCWPDGDTGPTPAAPAEPVLEGEVVDSTPEQTAPAAPTPDPWGHFDRLVAACVAFNAAIAQIDAAQARAGFDPQQAHHLEVAAGGCGWIESFLQRVQPTAPTGAPISGQLDILAEGVPSAEQH